MHTRVFSIYNFYLVCSCFVVNGLYFPFDFILRSRMFSADISTRLHSSETYLMFIKYYVDDVFVFVKIKQKLLFHLSSLPTVCFAFVITRTSQLMLIAWIFLSKVHTFPSSL